MAIPEKNDLIGKFGLLWLIFNQITWFLKVIGNQSQSHEMIWLDWIWLAPIKSLKVCLYTTRLVVKSQTFDDGFS